MLDADGLVRAAADAGWLARHTNVAVVLKASPAMVVRASSADGPRIVKAHRPGTDATALRQRLAFAAASALFVPPVSAEPVAIQNRLLSCWPAGQPVDPDRPDAAPWQDAARLLAGLHRMDVDRELPPVGVPQRLARMLRRLTAVDEPTTKADREAVWSAAEQLPTVDDATQATVCHGDFHLGQLVRCDGRWRLIDVDELGIGDPRWDLAWIAAWFAVGVLPPQVWVTLIDTYRAAGGTAVGVGGDPWPFVDAVARAATVHVAARSLVQAAEGRRDLDEVDQAFIDACVRMV